jgi:hypothetical protein
LEIPSRKSDRANKAFAIPGMDVRISADRNLWFRQSVGGDRKGMKERAEQPRDVSRQPETRVGNGEFFYLFSP